MVCWPTASRKTTWPAAAPCSASRSPPRTTSPRPRPSGCGSSWALTPTLARTVAATLHRETLLDPTTKARRRAHRGVRHLVTTRLRPCPRDPAVLRGCSACAPSGRCRRLNRAAASLCRLTLPVSNVVNDLIDRSRLGSPAANDATEQPKTIQAPIVPSGQSCGSVQPRFISHRSASLHDGLIKRYRFLSVRDRVLPFGVDRYLTVANKVVITRSARERDDYFGPAHTPFHPLPNGGHSDFVVHCANYAST